MSASTQLDTSMSRALTSRVTFSLVFLAVLMLLPLLAGCASGGNRALADGSPSIEPLALEVTNQGPTDVVVYLAEGSVPVRLGRVEAMRSTKLIITRVPKVDTLVRLLLRTGEGESYAPESVWASTGQIVQLTVRPLLRSSDVIVRMARGGEGTSESGVG